MGGGGVTLSDGALGVARGWLVGARAGLGAGPRDTAAFYCESPVHVSGNRSVWRDAFGCKKNSRKGQERK